MLKNIDRQERAWRKLVEKEAAAMRGRFKVCQTLNEMFPIKIEEPVEEPTPDFEIQKGGLFDGFFDFWYSPTVWCQYGHNIMNGARYTECVKSGTLPLSKKGFPDLVCVWKGIPWGKLTQYTTTQGYRDDFPERCVFKKYTNPEIEFPIKVIDCQKAYLLECLCRKCTEERIRKRVLAAIRVGQEELKYLYKEYDSLKISE